MNKQQLLALGLTEEQADKVLTGFEGYVPSTRFNEVNEAKKHAEALLVERDKQLEELKKGAGDNEKLQKQIEKLEAENKTAKENFEKSLNELKINNAVDLALTAKGAKNLKATRALLDFEKIKIKGDGFEGIDEQIDSLIADEGTKFLFEQVNANVPKGMTPPSGTNQPPKKAYKDMNYSERVAYLAAGGRPE